MKVALVGATGLVGQKMLEILEERKVQVSQLIPVASMSSVGKSVDFKGKPHDIVSIDEAVGKRPEIALFSAGSDVSLEYAPIFANNGCYVIDNSSAWRMKARIPLIVPEINGGILNGKDKIIANPNCSTIQLAMVLDPLHQLYKAKRVIISTYQSVSGTGSTAVNQMNNERNGIESSDHAYAYPIDRNCIPQCDVFVEDGYTKEELKMVNETRKILNDPTIQLTATAVRVPVSGGHSESVNISFEKPFMLSEIRELLYQTPGVTLMDDPKNAVYPMPLTAHGKDEVFVGRIRLDPTFPNSIHLWIVADNLRKGAATNAIQILEYLIAKSIL